MAVNKAKWNQISEADRATIKQASDEAMKREVEVLATRENGIIEDIATAGGKFHRPSPEEHERLSNAVKPLSVEVRKSVGPNGVALVDILAPPAERTLTKAIIMRQNSILSVINQWCAVASGLILLIGLAAVHKAD
jgi:Bacterial extracellular solute-binding protein, family 7